MLFVCSALKEDSDECSRSQPRFLILFGVWIAATPSNAAPRHHQHHFNRALTLSQRQQIFLYLTQTEYLASARFPGASANHTAQDAYADKLVSGVDRRYSITKAQGQAIINEGATKMWPIMGADGRIDHIH